MLFVWACTCKQMLSSSTSNQVLVIILDPTSLHIFLAGFTNRRFSAVYAKFSADLPSLHMFEAG